MKHPYVVALLADRPQETFRLAALPQKNGWQFHYELPDMETFHMIVALSLPPPLILIAESAEKAQQMGITILEDRYPRSSGWHDHHAIAISAEDDFLLYERAHQYPAYYEQLRLFIVSGVVVMEFGRAMKNRFTIVGTCAGNSHGEAFLRYRGTYLDYAFPPEFRSGFIARTQIVPEETIRSWRSTGLKAMLNPVHVTHIGEMPC